ncbi:MAG: DUF5074 domain-containing protein [Candidatus Aphodosoma sp.]
MNKTSKFTVILATGIMLLSSCNDMHDMPRPVPPTDTASNRIAVLCEGLFNMNNSMLATYDPNDGTLEYDVFKKSNKRGLGDTANDMQMYDGKLFVIVNVSSQLEIIDTATFESVKQIPFFNEDGVARQPRYMAFYGNNAYISCFDGYVARLNLTTLEITGWVRCGRNPDNIAVASGKLYVSNSGGLDNPNYDTTVSVIDLQSFTETKRIEVGPNPGSIASDSEGDIYVVTRGDYGNTDYALHKIDTEIDERIHTFDGLNPLNITIFNDIAYMYSYDYNTDRQWIKTFDCLTDRVISDNFITDGTDINTPYGLDVDTATGDVYITEAYNYVNWGDVLCFDRNGRLRFRINEIGLNPNTVTVLR